MPNEADHCSFLGQTSITTALKTSPSYQITNQHQQNQPKLTFSNQLEDIYKSTKHNLVRQMSSFWLENNMAEKDSKLTIALFRETKLIRELA
jgi:hypothetical protein